MLLRGHHRDTVLYAVATVSFDHHHAGPFAVTMLAALRGNVEQLNDVIHC
jgi:hypothetical protein